MRTPLPNRCLLGLKDLSGLMHAGEASVSFLRAHKKSMSLPMVWKWCVFFFNRFFTVNSRSSATSKSINLPTEIGRVELKDQKELGILQVE